MQALRLIPLRVLVRVQRVLPKFELWRGHCYRVLSFSKTTERTIRLYCQDVIHCGRSNWLRQCTSRTSQRCAFWKKTAAVVEQTSRTAISQHAGHAERYGRIPRRRGRWFERATEEQSAWKPRDTASRGYHCRDTWYSVREISRRVRMTASCSRGAC